MIKKKAKKLTYKQWTELAVDSTSHIFDETPKKEHASLGICLMTQAMSELYLSGFCQHQVGEMTIDALEQFIDMEQGYAKQEKYEAFPEEECDCEQAPIFETVKPISKIFH